MIRISKEKRDKLILVGIGAVAIVAGLWLGVIKTRREQIGLSQTKLEKAMEKLEKAKEETTKNIHEQLSNNKLDATELNDNRS